MLQLKTKKKPGTPATGRTKKKPNVSSASAKTSPTNLRLYDNTRVKESRECLRKYLYRHVFHWSRDSTDIPLVYGGCWHRAQEVIWPGLMDNKLDKEDIIKAAMAAWTDAWLNEYKMDPLDEIDMDRESELSPRSPMNALELIVAYVHKRAGIRQEFELLSVEQPFAVPLNPTQPDLYYIGKIDKIVRQKQRGKIVGIEHKTTTAYRKADNNKFRSQFLDSFSPNSQVDGYLFALHLTYPGEVGGVWIDASLVHKSEESFTFIPIEKNLGQLDLWLWEVQYWIHQIEENKRLLADASKHDRYLAAFPKNTNSCFNFNRACEYIDLCKSWTNPLGKPCPGGFHVEKWDPLDHLDKERLEI